MLRHLSTVSAGILALVGGIALPILLWHWGADVFNGGVMTAGMQIGQAASTGAAAGALAAVLGWMAWHRQVEEHADAQAVMQGELESAKRLLETVVAPT